MKKKILKINRFVQDPSYCAVASSACLANFFNKDIDYEKTKEIVHSIYKKETIREEGMDTGQICTLLNALGFQKVTVITSNLHIFDYTWENYSRNKMIRTLKTASRKLDAGYRESALLFHNWLKNKDYDNKIILDYDFSKYIQESIEGGTPAYVTFNWTMHFKYHKENEKGRKDEFKGNFTEHATIAYGIDNKNVHICDSHKNFYVKKLKRYSKGMYTVPWTQFMSIMGFGDVILVDNYVAP